MSQQVPSEMVPNEKVSTEKALPSPPSNCVRVMLVGDIVGKPGMRMACAAVDYLRSHFHIDLLVANAENAADGSGLRCKDYRRLVDHGYDAITLGDHAFRKREIMDILASETNIVRPGNWPSEAPGRASVIVKTASGTSVAVVSMQGRVFMKPVDCPFHAMDRELAALPKEVKVRFLDFHAEATSDMQLMGRYLAGRVSAVLGTHTHVATADDQILSGGTGFQCDVGMTGPFDSILGRKTPAVLEATLAGIPTPFQVATGDVRLNGTWFDADCSSGHCVALGRIDVSEATVSDFASQRAANRKVL